jgi:hypothetical protein
MFLKKWKMTDDQCTIVELIQLMVGIAAVGFAVMIIIEEVITRGCFCGM